MEMQRKSRRIPRVTMALLLLTGCAGLIGVPDLTLEETEDGGLTEGGSNLTDGQVRLDANGGTDTSTPINPNDANADTNLPPADSGTDSATCDLSAVATDPDHCGRCGHSCLGGTCTGGVCDATRIGIVSAGGLRFVVQHGDYIYASTFWRSSGDQAIYRIPKSGVGTPIKYYTRDYVEDMLVIGDTLYFIINDSPFDDAGDDFGGVWSCDLKGPVPCVPKIEAIADNPNGLTGDNGMLYFRNFGFVDEAIRAHAIDAGDIDASNIIGQTNSSTYLYFLWSGQKDLYSLAGRFPIDNENTYVSRYDTVDASPDNEGEELSRYTNPVATPGGLTGTPTAVYFAAYDFDTTTGGAVRRIARQGAPATDSSCNYGLGTERRPSGVWVDDANLYWTNQGDSVSPYGNGSVAYCAAHGTCCTTPNVIWRGEGEPVAITGDDKFIYWIGYRSGEVWKVAKP